MTTASSASQRDGCVDIRVAYFAGEAFYAETLDEGVPVVKYALDESIKTGVIMPCDEDTPYRLLSYEACSDSNAPALLAEAVYRQGVNVAIGPGCSVAMAATAKMAVYYNIPILGPKSMRTNLADKSIYKTLVRLSETLNLQAEALAQILKQYAWNTVSIIAKTPLRQSAFVRFMNDQGVDVKVHEFQQMHDQPLEKLVEAFRKVAASDARRTDKEEAVTHISVIVIDQYEFDGPFIREAAKVAEETRFLTEDRWFILSYVMYSPEPEQKGGIKFARNPTDANSDAVVEKLLRRSIVVCFLEKLEATTANQMQNERFRTEMLLITKKKKVYGKSANISKSSVGTLPLLFDTVTLYTKAVNACIATPGCNYTNGLHIATATHCKVFQGKSGEVAMNSEAEREGTVNVWKYTEKGEMEIIGELRQHNVCETEMTMEYVAHLPDFWPTGKPTDEPECGFSNENCQMDTITTALIATGSLVILTAIVTGLSLYISHVRLRKRLYEDVWKIDTRKLTYLGDQKAASLSHGSESVGSGHTVTKIQNIVAHLSLYEYNGEAAFVSVYRRTVVQLLNLSMMERKRLTQIRSLSHDNVATFFGMSHDSTPELFCAWQMCSRGRLADVLSFEHLDIDEAFVTSMIKDVAKGLTYIHSSPVQWHGSINSNAIHVDKRWVLKYVDTGIDEVLRRHLLEGSLSKEANEYDLLHRPPEELHALNNAKPLGSPAGDMYAAAMVVYQIVWKDLIFAHTDCSYQEIIHRVMNAPLEAKGPFRPLLRPTANIPSDRIATRTKNLLTECWAESPYDRPFAKVFYNRIMSIVGKGSRDLMDHMMTLMEKYTSNLERIVRERTQKVEDEKRRADFLLYQLLPRTVAEQLKTGTPVEPRGYRNATVFFSDIVEFTALCAKSTPMQVIATLNTVFNVMDNVLERFDVYKLETIGDAYMVVSGVPHENGDQHCCEIANMALAVRAIVEETEFVAHTTEKKLRMRFGISSGPTAAGIVGQIMPRYCLFGDTINVASQLESTGEPMKIHISLTAKNLLEKTNHYDISFRGNVELKGNGKQPTFWLNGHKPSEPEDGAANYTGRTFSTTVSNFNFDSGC